MPKVTDCTAGDAMGCPVERTLQVIGGRWKVLILRELLRGVQRFNQLRRALPRTTPKMLAQQLRELERDGVIRRQVYAQVPPKVEYSLTPTGRSLKPILEAMHQWARRYAPGRASTWRKAASSAGHRNV